jgi:hypothetical protein
MAGTTTAVPSSFKAELPQALHNFTTTSGHVFKVALIKVTPAGTYGAASTNYSNITGNSDEVTGTGYSAGGFAWTAAQNITPAVSGTASIWSWSVNPSWTTSTFSTTGCMIYNTNASNAAVYVGDFGGTQSVSAGTFTIVLPANTVGNSILQIS